MYKRYMHSYVCIKPDLIEVCALFNINAKQNVQNIKN